MVGKARYTARTRMEIAGNMRLRFLARIFSTMLGLALCSYAQNPTAQITGIITDSTGANVAGAEVEAQNVATGIVAKTTSNESGDYTFPILTPGAYSVVVR